jgi:hypothetical protein
MAALTIILCILLLLLAGFLFTPVSLYVDTDEGSYKVFQTPVFCFLVSGRDGTIVPRLQLAGINIPLQSKGKAKAKKTDKKPKRKSRFKKSISAWRFLIEKTLKSFIVNRAVVDLDTDDVVLNAHLVPVFFWASRGPMHLNINFNDRVYLHLQAYTRPARLLWIFIRFLTKK